jgi:murein DD-endopeptidase MepM/ murein hydrolase activator NlpD
VNTLTRILKTGCVGKDVEGVNRAMLRYLEDDQGWRLYVAALPVVRRTWGAGKTRLAKRSAAKAGLPQLGVFGPKLETALRAAGAFDMKANKLIDEYNDAHPPKPAKRPMYFPVPEGQRATVCQGLHETAGISGNWAIDICTPPNTTVVAAEAGIVTKLSGRSPWDDTWDSQGVFGWSIHFRTDQGYSYYLTHLGKRLPSLYVGIRVEAGDTLGWVGDQRFRPDHVHYGCSSPAGEADARQHILQVADAPRIH